MGKKILRNLKSRSYEVMEGNNIPGHVETLQVDRLSPDSTSTRNGDVLVSNGNSHINPTFTEQSSLQSSMRKVREPGAEIEMTAAVSGVVPDGNFFDIKIYV